MSIDIEQFHTVFFDESQEHLDAMEQGLMALDVDNPDLEDVNSIFRAAHSIKGGSGIFGFDALTRLTHVMENLLDKARKGTHQLDVATVDLFLETVDLLKVILDAYREGSALPETDIERGEQALEAALNGSTESAPASSSKEEAEKGAQSVKSTDDNSTQRYEENAEAATDDDDGFGFFDIPEQGSLASEAETSESEEKDSADDIEGFGFFDIPEQGSLTNASQEDSTCKADTSDDIEGFGFFDIPEPGSLTSESSAPSPDSAATSNTHTSDTAEAHNDYGFFTSTLPIPAASEGEGVEYGFFDKQKQEISAKQKVNMPTIKPSRSATSESASIRVDTQKIDAMVNLVGELVITQSMLSLLSEEVAGSVGEKLQNAIAELQRNTREIQESAMSMRMLPLNMTFNRFPRVVRDLSSKLGKKVDLQLEGGNTEIDKSMIEKLVDPLTHLVRNSIDHGIETTEQRRAAGKSETGTVTLRAMQKGSSIQISILDDGAGLNRERITNKAAENGITVDPTMPDAEVWQLIFQPGFSTAAEVTDVSGRGVGMDVVKRNIESIGGRIDIESTAGKGSSFSISLPLTLAIVDGISVAVGEQIFVLPLVNIIESIQPLTSQLKYIGNERLLWIREQYWPLVTLHDVMSVENAQSDPTQGIVVLLESGKRRFGILVDALLGQQQVVIKSLERHYRKVPGVSGATIMGDGRVAMIIDVEGIAELCQTPDVESLSA